MKLLCRFNKSYIFLFVICIILAAVFPSFPPDFPHCQINLNQDFTSEFTSNKNPCPCPPTNQTSLCSGIWPLRLSCNPPPHPKVFNGASSKNCYQPFACLAPSPAACRLSGILPCLLTSFFFTKHLSSLLLRFKLNVVPC